MNIKILSLLIHCKKENVLVTFSNGITFIYGNAGVGKSTLANLISYAFGNSIVKTQVAKQEIEGVSLNTIINGNLVVLTRKMNSNLISLKSDDSERVLVAKKKNPMQESFSDYLYSTAGITPITMLRGNSSKEIYISFSNYMWYSYLRQEELDNTMFYLGENKSNFKELASTNVLKIMLEEKEIFETGINIEINRMREELVAANNRLQISKGIIAKTKLSKINISHEIARKQRLITQKETLLNLPDTNDFFEFSKRDLEALFDEYRKLGKYEAEIVYLNEFLKIQELTDQYSYEISSIKNRIDYFEALKKESSNYKFEKNIKELESIFFKCLQDVKFSYIDKTDHVIIDRKTLIPSVYTEHNRFKFDYYNLSSGGKKTIFKICFALSIHIFAIKNRINSLLPQFIIIDTPMKNISEREDNELYDRLYTFFSNLFSKEGLLNEVQLIIIDKELPKVFSNTDVLCKHFTNETPLIPYYIEGIVP